MFDEATILRVADAYERDTTWWMQSPPGFPAGQSKKSSDRQG
jgi:hypothetical protein